MRRRYPPDLDSNALPSRVFRTGTAELIPEVTDRLLQSLAQSSEHLQMLREIGAASLIIVPLRARERSIGTIMLENGKASRQFGPEDLELAEDLALRAALQSRMRRCTSRSGMRDRGRAVGRADRTDPGCHRGPVRGVVAGGGCAVLIDKGAVAIGADGGFVRLLTHDGQRLELVASVGISERFARSYRNLMLTSSLPGVEVFLTGTESYFDSAAAIRSASPEFAREHEATGHEAIAFVPIRVRTRRSA